MIGQADIKHGNVRWRQMASCRNDKYTITGVRRLGLSDAEPVGFQQISQLPRVGVVGAV